MKKLTLALLCTFIAPPAFALQATNCSNATASITRVENEVWGANLIKYTIHGETFKQWDLEINEGKKVLLEKTGDVNSVEGETQIYAVKTTFKRKDGGTFGSGVELKEISDYLICNAWQNSSRD